MTESPRLTTRRRAGGLLGRLVALVVTVVGLALALIVGWIVLAVVIGFLVVAALVALVRAWWRGDRPIKVDARRTVVDITPDDERRS